MLERLMYFMLTAAEGSLSVFGVRGLYEEPRYAVVERLGGDVESRSYQARTAAETTATERGNQDAGSLAFQRLFGYISGNNRQRTRLAMTAPVAFSSKSARIAMTAPVQMQTSEPGTVTMQFFLPHGFDAHNAPVPADPEVRIVAVPLVTLAVQRFSGPLSAAAIAANQRLLAERIAGTPWRISGQRLTLAYDPPFTIPFLRRNEVAVPVTRAL